VDKDIQAVWHGTLGGVNMFGRNKENEDDDYVRIPEEKHNMPHECFGCMNSCTLGVVYSLDVIVDSKAHNRKFCSAKCLQEYAMSQEGFP